MNGGGSVEQITEDNTAFSKNMGPKKRAILSQWTEKKGSRKRREVRQEMSVGPPRDETRRGNEKKLKWTRLKDGGEKRETKGNPCNVLGVIPHKENTVGEEISHNKNPEIREHKRGGGEQEKKRKGKPNRRLNGTPGPHAETQGQSEVETKGVSTRGTWHESAPPGGGTAEKKTEQKKKRKGPGAACWTRERH